MSTTKLTPRQKVVLAMIAEFIRDHEYSPTVREIAIATGVTSPNGVICHLNALEKKGFITRDRHTARSTRLIIKWHESGDNVLRLLRHMIYSGQIGTWNEVKDFIEKPDIFEADWNALQEAAGCPDTHTT